jgi:hypothetical protein
MLARGKNNQKMELKDMGTKAFYGYGASYFPALLRLFIQRT